MIKEFVSNHKFALKWLAIAFLIKLSLFIFFAFNFLQNWPAHLIVNKLFIISGDTSGYYGPLESFVKGTGYDSFCRMPGLLPFYSFFRLILNETWSKTFIIISQFLAGVISVYFLAQIARIVFKNIKIFYLTFFIYSFSSFVSIWDHYGYSDSFGTSLLIFSVYFLVIYKNSPKLFDLLLSSIFITWSIFFRPVNGILLPFIVLFYLFDLKNLTYSIYRIFLYSLPVIICLGLWTFKNYKSYDKFIVLQGSFEECFGSLPKEHLAIRDLIIAWGGDYQPWSKGSEAEWFYTPFGNYKSTSPITPKLYTSIYNLDSLRKLKEYYDYTENDSLPDLIRNQYRNKVITTSKIYLDSFKKEHYFHAIIFSKLSILKQLLLPRRLDDLPFPAFVNMNIIQKLVKGGYFLLLLLVNILGVVGSFIYLLKGNRLVLFPLVLISTIGIFLGFVEQRYLVPIYPFFVIISSALIIMAYTSIKKKRFGHNSKFYS